MVLAPRAFSLLSLLTSTWAILRRCELRGKVGCHGFTHGIEENYGRMSEPMQRDYIRQATDKLQNLVGEPIRAFRGPRVKTSATTLRLLAGNGYLTDSSVCS